MQPLTINFKLTLFTLVITTLSLISAGLLIDQSLLNYHREVAQQTIQDAFASLRENIHRIEKKLVHEAASVADDELMIAGLNLINNYETPDNYNPILFDEEKKHIGDRLLASLRTGEADEGYLYDTRGQLLVYASSRGSRFFLGIVSNKTGERIVRSISDASPDSWHMGPFTEKVMDRMRQHMADRDGIDYHRDSSGLVVEFHQPLVRTFADGNSTRIGDLVFVNRVDEEFIQSLTSSDISFSLFDSTQEPLLKTAHFAVLDSNERTRILTRSGDDLGRYENRAGFYGTWKLALQNGDWIHLVAHYPISEYTIASQKTRWAVLVAILVTAALIIPSIVLLLHRLIRKPLTDLMQGVQRLRAGEYDTQLPVISNDELGELASAMNLMTEDIRQRESELSAIVDHMPLMIFVKEAKSLRFVRLNRAGEKLLGTSEQQLVGRNDYDLFPTEQADFFTSMDREVLNLGSVVDIPEEQIDTPSGIRFLHTRKATIHDSEGNPKYLLGVSEDITDRKQTGERLRQWSKVIDSTSEAMMITDLEGSILDVNRAFSLITGYNREEIIGHNPRIFKSGYHKEDFYQLMWKSVLQSGSWRGEIHNRRKNGEVYPAWETISTVYNENNVPTHLVSVFSDISPIKKTQEKLDFLAHHDPLTGLPNRILLNDRMEHAIMRAHRDAHGVAVMFLDLDRFKNINDSLGHPVGDELLKEVASRLQHVLREIDTVSRQGGDEFVLVLEDIKESESLVDTARKVLSVLDRPFQISGREMVITASLGISLYPDDGSDATTLIRNADAAMYRAKENGRNGFWFYTEDITHKAAKRVDMEQALRETVKHGELHLYYQPQFNLPERRINGVEALIRWDRPGQGLVMPSEFIPLAEETGMINAIGEWVIYSACRQMARWLSEGIPLQRIAINISPAQIRQGNLAQIVEDALNKSNLDARHLELEVTEAIFLDDTEQAGQVLRELDELGVQLALDDFGTGFSSLSYLKNFRFDRLKIDRSFTQNLHENANDRCIANSIIALGHSLNMTVLAEGVETEAQLAWLAERGCDDGQGYLFSRPVPAEQLCEVIAVETATVPEQEHSDRMD